MESIDFLRGLRPTWAEVNLNNIQKNFVAIRQRLSSHVRVIGVVKADAYGHGAVPVALRLQSCGIDALAVAILEEACPLREAGISRPILLLGRLWPGQEEALIRHQITPTVFDTETVTRLAGAAKSFGRKLAFQLKVDTGMTRLGVPYDETYAFLERWGGGDGAFCEGVYTHLACADEPDHPINRKQLERFRLLSEALRERFPSLAWFHIANSAGTLNFPEAWLDSVRLGLLLYGISPLSGADSLQLTPALHLRTAVMQLKRIKAGSYVGYGATFRTERESLIAILPVGYADGFDRSLSNKGSVLVGGGRASIVGRVSMDLTAVDVTHLPLIQLDDEVCLIGRQGREEITAVEFSQWADTIPYEILCRIGKRVPRFYCE